MIDEYVSNADIDAKGGQFRFGSARKKVISATHQTATFGATQQQGCGMTMPRKAALALLLTGLSLAPGPVSAAECRQAVSLIRRGG